MEGRLFLAALLYAVITLASANSNTSLVLEGCQNSALLTRSQNTYQMLCEPKTGTTVMDWVVRRLFEKTAQKINQCNSMGEGSTREDGEAVFTSKTEESGLKYAGNKLYFTRHYKHDSYWPDVLNRDTIRGVAAKCIEKNIPAWTKECLDYFPDLTPIKKNASDFSIVVTMRDPIAIAMSGLYYAKGELSTATLNELMLGGKGCLYIAPYIALRYSLAYVLKAYGYNVELSFYEDFRMTPKRYMYNFIRFLGLEVEDDIVSEVLEETSISESKKAQEMIDSTPEGERSQEMQTMWRGIGNNPNNYRKVRSGEVRGYMGKLDPETLKTCVLSAKFHLPPELKDRYFSNFTF